MLRQFTHRGNKLMDAVVIKLSLPTSSNGGLRYGFDPS